MYRIKEGPWKGLTYRELYENIEVPLEWTIIAKQIADKENNNKFTIFGKRC